MQDAVIQFEASSHLQRFTYLTQCLPLHRTHTTRKSAPRIPVKWA